MSVYEGEVAIINAQMVAFVRKLNREGVKVETVVAAVRKEAARQRSIDTILSGSTRAEMFSSNTFDWLWVEPESLRQRRINGELNPYFRFKEMDSTDEVDPKQEEPPEIPEADGKV